MKFVENRVYTVGEVSMSRFSFYSKKTVKLIDITLPILWNVRAKTLPYRAI